MIELEPFGLTPGIRNGRPVMLFREKGGEATLPVWLSPLDAGIALGQRASRLTTASPHDVSLRVLHKVGVKIESCRFCEVKGHQQYVELKFSGHGDLKPMRFRADDAVSFCLQARARFFCSRKHIARVRDVDATMERTQFAINTRANARRSGTRYLN